MTASPSGPGARPPRPSPGTLAGLDHVSLAVEAVAPELAVFAGQLGGALLPGGREAGFRGCQLRYRGGGKLELLEPIPDPNHPFLRRFLDRRGPGPHHLTFVVDDLDRTLERAEALGWHPVQVDRAHPLWQEAFLHPREALGTTVQLAQPGWPAMRWQDAVPPPLRVAPPLPAAPRPAARLVRTDHHVPDRHEGLRLYRELLQGAVVGPLGRGADHADIRFAGGGRIRILWPPAPERGAPLGQAGIGAIHFRLPLAGPGAPRWAGAGGRLTAAGTQLDLDAAPT